MLTVGARHGWRPVHWPSDGANLSDDDANYSQPHSASAALADGDDWSPPDPESGRLGEDFVLGYERSRLQSAGQIALAARIKDVRHLRGLGYDILSFSTDGRERHLEVKSSRGDWLGVFYLTAREDRARREYPHFEFAFVSDSCGAQPTVRFARPDELDLDYSPVVFRVREARGP